MNAPDDLLAQELTDTFDALSAGFTPAPLDAAALWRDGRKDRRRDLLQLVAAVAVFVLLLTCTVVAAPAQILPATAPNPDSGDAGALPSTVHLPGHDDDVESLPSFPSGRVSVAVHLSAAGGLYEVLLVDAVDGEHHVVQVPDLDASSSLEAPGPGIWLSPDGWHLAYPTFRRPAAGIREAGLNVVDLRDGTVTSAPVTPAGATGLRVSDLAWSPDSSRFVWTASVFDTSDGGSASVTHLGLGTPSAPVGKSVDVPRAAATWGATPALSDDGTVVLASGGRRSLWDIDGDSLAFVATHRSTGPTAESAEVDGEIDGELSGTAFNPDGDRIVTGLLYDSFAGGTAATVSHPVAELRAEDDAVVAGEIEEWSFDADSENGVDPGLRLLGATPDGALLLQPRFPAMSLHRTDTDGRDSSSSEPLPVLMELRSDDGTSGYAPSVATALGDREPVAFAAPAWARDWTWVWWALAALVAAVAVATRVRKLRQATPTPKPDRRDAMYAARQPGHPGTRPTVGFTIGFFLTSAFLAATALSALPFFAGVVVALALTVLVILWTVKMWRVGAAPELPNDPADPGPGSGQQVLVLGAAALVAVVVTVWALAPLRPYSPKTAVPSGALPAVVEAPQGRSADLHPGTRGVTPPEAAGRLSVVTRRSGELAMGVSAVDGRHMMLDVSEEEFYATGPREITVTALSPDGTLMVSGWQELGATTAKTRSGLRLLDLSAGTERTVAFTGTHGRPVTVEQVAFSPDGTHLAWVGDEMLQLDDGGLSWSGSARTFGVTRVDELTDTAWRVPRAADDVAVAVANDGTARMVVRRHLVTVSADAPDAEPIVRPIAPARRYWHGAVVSPDGTQLVVGTLGSARLENVDVGLQVLDLTDPAASMRSHGWLPDGTPSVRPLGWSPSGDLVVAAQYSDGYYVWNGDGPAVTVTALRELSPPALSASALQFEARALTVAHGADTSAFAVATDLADLAPVAFGEQRWAVSDEHLWGLGACVVVTLTLLVLLVRKGIPARRRLS